MWKVNLAESSRGIRARFQKWPPVVVLLLVFLGLGLTFLITRHWLAQSAPLVGVLISLLLFLGPGMALALAFAPEDDWTERIPLAMVLSWGLASFSGLVVLGLHLSIIHFAWLYLGLSLLSFAVAYFVSRRQPPRPRPERPPIMPVLLIFALVGGAAMLFLAYQMPLVGDDWAGMPWLWHFNTAENINLLSPHHGIPLESASRSEFFFHALDLSLLSVTSQLDPLPFYTLIRPFFVIAALLAFYSLARSVIRRRNGAIFALIIWMVLLVLLYHPNKAGYQMLERIVQDKFFLRFIIFPVALRIFIDTMHTPGKRHLVLLAATSWAAGTVHPIGPALIGLSAAAFGVAHFLYAPRRETIRQLVPAGLAISVGLLLPIWQLVKGQQSTLSFVSAGEGLLAPMTLSQLQLTINTHRLWILENGNQILHPSTVLNAPTLLAFACLPFLIWSARRRVSLRLLIGMLVLVTPLFFIPLTASLLSKLVTTWLLWRLAWITDLAVWLTLSVTAWAILEQVFKRIRWPRPEKGIYRYLLSPALQRNMVLALVVAVLVAGILEPTFAANHALVQNWFAQRRQCQDLYPAFAPFAQSLEENVVVLADSGMNFCLPGFAPEIKVVEYRDVATIQRFGNGRETEARQRLADVATFTAARFVDEAFAGILDRYEVRYVVVPEDRFLNLQLAYLTDWFTLHHQAPGYRVYAVAAQRPPSPIVDGYTALANGDWAAAEDYFTAGMDGEEQPPFLNHLGLAQLYGETGRLEESLAHLEQALALEPEEGLLSIWLGDALMATHQFRAALPAYEQAVATLPDPTPALNRLGDAYHRLGQKTEAMAAYQAAAEQQAPAGSARYHTQLGNSYLRAGYLPEAKDIFYRLTRQLPTDPGSWTAYGNAALSLEKWTQAEYAFSQAAQADRWDFGAQLGLIRAQIESGPADNGVELLQDYLRNAPFTPVAYQLLVEEIEAESDAYQAMAVLQELEATRLGLPLPLSTLARLHGEVGQTDEALQLYDQVLYTDPVNAGTTRAEIGLTWEAIDRLDEALAAFREARQLGADISVTRLGLGRVYQEQGQYPVAVGQYFEATRENPLSGASNIALGRGLYNAGRIEAAVSVLESVAAFEPDNAATHQALGDMYNGLGRLDEAREQYQTARQLEPEGNDMRLVQVYQELGDLTSLSSLLEEAVRSDPDSVDLRVALANFYMTQGRPEAAFTQYKEAIAIDPLNAAGYIGLSQYFLAQQNGNEAGETLQQALDSIPEDYRLYNELANLALRRGQEEEALTWLTRGVGEAAEKDKALINLGGEYFRRGSARQAAELFQEAIDIAPENPAGYVRLAETFRFQGDFGRAEDQLRAALAAIPISTWATVSLGDILQRQGQIDPAIAAYEQAMQLDSSYTLASTNLATLYQGLGRVDEAREVLLTAIELNPGAMDLRLALAQLERNQGRISPAVTILEEATAFQPGNIDALLALGNLHQSLGEFAAAETEFRTVLRLAPGNDRSWFALGQLQMVVGEHEAAEASLRQAVLLNQVNEKAWLNLGDLWRAQGRITEALDAYESAIAADRRQTTGYLRASEWHLAHGSRSAAINLLADALEGDHSQPDLYRALAQIYVLAGDRPAAEETLLAATTANPGSLPAFVFLGNYYASLGRWVEARAAYDQALRLPGDHTLVYLALGNLSGARGNGAEAVSYYEQAIAIAPGRDNLYPPLINYYRNQGEWDRVEQIITDAIELSPASPLLHDALSQAHLAQGNLDEALAAAQLARDYAAGEAEYRQIIGEIYQFQGRYDLAEDAYRQAAGLAQHQAAPLVALGDLYVQKGLFAEAQDAYAAAMAQDAGQATAAIQLGELQARLGVIDAAETHFRRALWLDSGNEEAVVDLGDLLLATGRPEEAHDLFQAAQTDNPLALTPRSRLATEQERLGNFAAAEAIYKQSTVDLPGMAQAWVELGNFYLDRGRLIEAENAYLNALTLPSPKIEVQVALGKYDEGRGADDRAVAAYEQAIALQPTNLHGYLALGNFLVNHGLIAEAIDLYSQILATVPTANLLYPALATAYTRMGRSGEALAVLQEGVSSSPADPELEEALAKQYAAQGEWTAALETIGQALTWQPGNLELALAQGLLLEDLRRFDEAEEFYAAQLQIFPGNPDLLASRGRVAAALGRDEEAVAFYEEAVDADRSDVETLVELAGLYLEEKQVNAAEAAYQDALASNRIYEKALTGLGDLAVLADENEQALTYYTAAVRDNPISAAAKTALGNYYLHVLADPEEAIRTFEQAQQDDANYLGAYIGLGEAYEMLEDFERALTLYETGTKLNPTEARGHTVLGNAYRSRERYDEAIAAYLLAIQADPAYIYSYLALGYAYELSGREEEAISAYQQAVDLDPHSAQAWLALGNIYRTQGEHDAAIAAYTESLALDPDAANTLQAFGQFYFEQGNYNQALEYLIPATENDETLYIAPFYTGLAYERLGYTNSALNYYFISAARNGVFAPTFQGLGRVFREQGAFERALSYFETANRISPNSGNYLAMGNIYRNNLQQIEQAIAAYQAGIEVDHGCVFCYINLGHIYREAEDLETAVSYYEGATRAAPANALAWNALGLGYRLTERWDQAITAYERSLQLDHRQIGSYLGIINVYNRWSVAQQGRPYIGNLIPRYAGMQDGALWQKTMAGFAYAFNNADPGRALSLFLDVLDQDPGYTRLHREVALIYQTLGDAEAELRHWQLYLPAAPAAEIEAVQQRITQLGG